MYGLEKAAIMVTNASIAISATDSAIYDLPPRDEGRRGSTKTTTFNNDNTIETRDGNGPSFESIYSRNLRSLDSGAATVIDENLPYCRALYDFRGEYANELSFGAGDIVYLHRRVDADWLKGELQGGCSARAGIFPASFVEIVVDLPATEEPTVSATINANEPMLDTTSSSVTAGVALVTHDFDARYSDELTVRAGDSLKVVELLNENWARCQHSATGELGIVPQSFLQIFLENEPTLNWPLANGDGEMPSLFSSASAHQLSTVTASSSAASVGAESATYVPWNTIEWAMPAPSNETTIQRSHLPLSTVMVEQTAGGPKPTAAAARQPPQRPPLPNKLTLLAYSCTSSSTNAGCGTTEHQTASMPQIIGPNRPPADFQEQKMRIVQDLLTTETTYLFDLNSWEACIFASTSLSEENKKVLNHGFPQLKELSKKLIDNIQSERAKTPDVQCYGQVLMFMREDFYRTFSHHCRTVEKISQILENMSDAGLKAALNGCVVEMRKMGSQVFDAPTALSRPIHRCLKYPLYVGELLKNTPINHIDHPKLMEALKQLGSLASKMNECKRRKELIRKYTDDQQLTLTERLARINVHSLVKKSNRLKYRISSTMGLNTIRDSEFDYLIAQLDGAERRICKFLYCAQLYKKNVELACKKYEDLFRGPSPIDDERQMKRLCEFLEDVDKIRKNFLTTFDKLFLDEGRKLIRNDYTKLIHKRCDKLADYETAKTTNKNAEELEMRRNEYEALNNQVKSVMPRLITNINKQISELVHGVHEADGRLIASMDALLHQRCQQPDKWPFTDQPPFSGFVSALLGTNRFAEMNRILRNLPQSASVSQSVNGGTTTTADTVSKFQGGSRIVTRAVSVKDPKKKIIRKLSGLSMRQKPSTTGVSMARAQTPKERDALVKIIRAQGTADVLRRVAVDYAADGLLLNVGDVVLVKSHKNGKCLCDNGVTVGYVPHDYLWPVDDADVLMLEAGGVPLLNTPVRTAPTIPTTAAGRTTNRLPPPPPTVQKLESTGGSFLDEGLILDFSPTPSSMSAPSNPVNGGIDLSGMENLKHFQL